MSRISIVAIVCYDGYAQPLARSLSGWLLRSLAGCQDRLVTMR